LITGIAEWYSPVAPGTGLHPRPGPTPSLQTFFPEVDPSWETLFYPSRKGETVAELHERIDTFIRAFGTTLEQRLPAESTRRLLMVSHAATTIALVRSLTGDRELPMKVGCCSITELDKREDLDKDRLKEVIGVWKPIMLVSGDHLKGGSSREWGFEDIEVEKGRVRQPGFLFFLFLLFLNLSYTHEC
jgi:transcription factor C subunit 7